MNDIVVPLISELFDSSILEGVFQKFSNKLFPLKNLVLRVISQTTDQFLYYQLCQ